MIGQNTPVLIVGGGPVGLALSIDLSWRGVRHVLIDRSPRAARAEHPRMDQIGIRTMEHIRRWGAVADVETAGFPRTLRRDVVFATAVLGYELEREPMECDATRSTPLFSPQKHELCPQNFFDPLLQTLAERSSVASIHYEAQLLDFEDKGDSVIATIQAANGAQWRLESQFLAGCDGASSLVARKLAIASSTKNTLAYSTNIFFDSRELSERAGTRRGYRYIILEANGVWASVANMDGRDGWRLQILGGADWPTWSEKQAKTAVDRAIGCPVMWSLKAIVPWARRECVAERFSKGRCFLVGDAAHQLSPTGGYGMTTGIGEAVDLSWKIAATLAGWGGKHLLDTYHEERRPIAIRNARRATENFDRMRSAPGDEALLDPTPRGDEARRRVGQAVRAAMREEWQSMGIHLGYHYAGSPIVSQEADSHPSDDPVDYLPTTRPGARAPHVWLRDRLSTLDLLGREFTLMVFRPGADVSPLLSAAKERGVPLRLEMIDLLEAAVAYEFTMVLVRPDGHVAWRGNEPPTDSLMLLDLIRGERMRAEYSQSAVRFAEHSHAN